MKEKITLVKLAEMVAKGFENTASKEEMNNRFNQVDQRLGQVDQRLDNLERKVDKVDMRVDQVHEILDREEKDFLGLQKRVQVLEKINKAQHH